MHVDQVFNFKLRDGEAPAEATIRDKDGNIDESKLMDQSLKNEEKKLPVQKKKPK